MFRFLRQQRTFKTTYDAYAVYVIGHGVAGATFGAGVMICGAIEEGEIVYCCGAPLAAFAGGLLGIMAGVIPGVTPIAGAAILYKNSKEKAKKKS